LGLGWLRPPLNFFFFFNLWGHFGKKEKEKTKKEDSLYKYVMGVFWEKKYVIGAFWEKKYQNGRTATI
jgi:hypothetical protein